MSAEWNLVWNTIYSQFVCYSGQWTRRPCLQNAIFLHDKELIQSRSLTDNLNILVSSPDAEVLPPVGPLSLCTLKSVHPDEKDTALMAEILHMLCRSMSHAYTGWNTLACDPVGERVRFRVGRVGAKGRGGSLLTVSFWERCLHRALKGSRIETHTNTQHHGTSHERAAHTQTGCVHHSTDKCIQRHLAKSLIEYKAQTHAAPCSCGLFSTKRTWKL